MRAKWRERERRGELCFFIPVDLVSYLYKTVKQKGRKVIEGHVM